MTKAHRVFIVGIKGAAMAHIAIILKKIGVKVSGSDTKEEFITDQILTKHAVTVYDGFSPKLIPPDVDLVIYSAAHKGRFNPQIAEAEKRNVRVLSQAQFLGELLTEFHTKIAVSGCHGKTTTSSLLAYALIKLHKDPSYLVGAPSFGQYEGADYQGKKYFVVEADEYGVNPPHDKTPKFHFLHPTHIICTNIDFDHPDVYADLAHTKREFTAFFNNALLFLNADDTNLASLFPKISLPYLTYGEHEKADLRISNVLFTQVNSQFDLHYKNKAIGKFVIRLAGRKNVSNAAAVVLTLLELGFSPDDIRTSIADFAGAKRRFEFLTEKNGILFFDDYAHHPHEIDATVDAARLRFPGRRIILIFQPHTFSRTFMLKKEFARSLSRADRAFLLPVFPSAREHAEDYPVSSAHIQTITVQNHSGNVTAYPSGQKLIDSLFKELREGDIVFTMGAGDVYKLKDDIITRIKSHGYKSPT